MSGMNSAISRMQNRARTLFFEAEDAPSPPRSQVTSEIALPFQAQRKTMTRSQGAAGSKPPGRFGKRPSLVARGRAQLSVVGAFQQSWILQMPVTTTPNEGAHAVVRAKGAMHGNRPLPQPPPRQVCGPRRSGRSRWQRLRKAIGGPPHRVRPA